MASCTCTKPANESPLENVVFFGTLSFLSHSKPAARCRYPRSWPLLLVKNGREQKSQEPTEVFGPLAFFPRVPDLYQLMFIYFFGSLSETIIKSHGYVQTTQLSTLSSYLEKVLEILQLTTRATSFSSTSTRSRLPAPTCQQALWFGAGPRRQSRGDESEHSRWGKCRCSSVGRSFLTLDTVI